MSIKNISVTFVLLAMMLFASSQAYAVEKKYSCGFACLGGFSSSSPCCYQWCLSKGYTGDYCSNSSNDLGLLWQLITGK